jgi:hypothetical protein
MRTYEEVDFVHVSGATCGRSSTGQRATGSVGKLLRSLQTCHISDGAKVTLAISLEGKHWEASAASSCSALIQPHPCSVLVQNLGHCPGPIQIRPSTVIVAALVPVRWPCSVIATQCLRLSHSIVLPWVKRYKFDSKF